MSPAPTLSDYQQLASSLEADVDELAQQLRSPAARLRTERAVGMLHAAVRELGAAIAYEHLCTAPAAPAASYDAPLTATVISPGADRADELVRSLPADVLALTERQARLRLGTPADATGARIVREVMMRNGWRTTADGVWWNRPGFGAAAGVAPEQPR